MITFVDGCYRMNGSPATLVKLRQGLEVLNHLGILCAWACEHVGEFGKDWAVIHYNSQYSHFFFLNESQAVTFRLVASDLCPDWS